MKRICEAHKSSEKRGKLVIRSVLCGRNTKWSKGDRVRSECLGGNSRMAYILGYKADL